MTNFRREKKSRDRNQTVSTMRSLCGTFLYENSFLCEPGGSGSRVKAICSGDVSPAEVVVFSTLIISYNPALKFRADGKTQSCEKSCDYGEESERGRKRCASH